MSLGVVLTAGGYPGSYRKGDEIFGLDQNDGESKVFHAGTARQEGRVVTAGGRVLCVCALAENIRQAKRKAYERVATLCWKDMAYRKDIGYRAVAREEAKADAKPTQ